ncbi:MAG: cell division protein FtsQ/DivIB [Candidatus Planktophila sp.]
MPRKVKILLAVILISTLTYLFGWSSVFTVKKIEYKGLTNAVQISAVERKVGNLNEIKLARIEPRRIANSIKTLSWIKDVDVTRDWITSSVTISVTARVPIGAFAGRYIDATGAIFDPVGPATNVPQVSAPTPEIGLLAVKLFTSLPEDFRQNILSMNARSASDFSMTLRGQQRGLTLRFGSAEEIDLKIKVFNALTALEENKNISTIDVSAPHAPIVK